VKSLPENAGRGNEGFLLERGKNNPAGPLTQ
jgi:hypothetical protein